MIPGRSSKRAPRPSGASDGGRCSSSVVASRSAIADVSPDAITVPYAPHELVFPFARAIVHQGGIGTLSEALLAGKPMLIMPYGHDQADNAWRASRLGVARVVPRGRYRAGVVAASWHDWWTTRCRAWPRSAVSREVSRERGCRSRAADLIEAALR